MMVIIRIINDDGHDNADGDYTNDSDDSEDDGDDHDGDNNVNTNNELGNSDCDKCYSKHLTPYSSITSPRIPLLNHPFHTTHTTPAKESHRE